MNKLILSLFLIVSIQSLAQITKLNLASDIWPPFTNVENEKSIATDLVKEALSRQNINSSIMITSFDDVLNGIESGKYDGSGALWISEKRKEKYLFSKPYLHNQLILVGRKGSDVSANSFSELKGKRLGVIENYAYGDVDGIQNVTFISGKNNQQNLESLLSEKIDYILVDALIIQYMLKYQMNDVTEYLEIGNTTLLTKSLHFAIRKDIRESDLIISRFNKEIEKMIADGSYHRILELNWIKTDIDRDGKLELVLDGNRAGIESPENTYAIAFPNSNYNKLGNPTRYYIEGKLYEDWNDVPQDYKIDLIRDSTPSQNDAIIRLKF